jgi:acyl-coenzyme A synthetase/AMP-(fatty) acid ligase
MLRSVRLFNFLGEPLLREQLRAIFAARPDVAVNNTYGPTEATVSMTLLRLTGIGLLIGLHHIGGAGCRDPGHGAAPGRGLAPR